MDDLIIISSIQPVYDFQKVSNKIKYDLTQIQNKYELTYNGIPIDDYLKTQKIISDTTIHSILK